MQCTSDSVTPPYPSDLDVSGYIWALICEICFIAYWLLSVERFLFIIIAYRLYTNLAVGVDRSAPELYILMSPLALTISSNIICLDTQSV